MASRLRQLVILGPPIIIILAAASGGPPLSPAPSDLRDLAGPAAACGSMPGASQSPVSGGSAVMSDHEAGGWWTQQPILDATGTLTGWTLTVGASETNDSTPAAGAAGPAGAPGARGVPTAPNGVGATHGVGAPLGVASSMGAPGRASATLELPPASIVSGPVHGRVVVATDDGTASGIRIVDTGTACAWSVPIPAAIVRRAVLEPGSQAALAHLLDRTDRRDLGIWRVPLDGGTPSVLVGPPTSRGLADAGIERVWSTDLRLAPDGTRVAVQSCDPHGCLTRVQDLATGSISTLNIRQGALIGFAGDRLVTVGPCASAPCPILTWDVSSGHSEVVAAAALGADVTADGQVIVAVAGEGDGETPMALALDPVTGSAHVLGTLRQGLRPSWSREHAGLETRSDAVALFGQNGLAGSISSGGSIRSAGSINSAGSLRSAGPAGSIDIPAPAPNNEVQP